MYVMIYSIHQYVFTITPNLYVKMFAVLFKFDRAHYVIDCAYFFYAHHKVTIQTMNK